MNHKYDYYAVLKSQTSLPQSSNEYGLASGFVDECTVWSDKNKEDARECYMKQAKKAIKKELPSALDIEPNFNNLPDPSWLGIEVEFTLETPWYSKDDRPFHVMDNPVRKDRVFGVPFMSATSWKGMLRWACRMEAGLLDHLEKNGNTLKQWKDPDWIIHFFGNEKGETDKYQAGALVFYPTWFDRVGFEVINPHERKTKKGKNPIYYEVVPVRTSGCLRLLYAPLPGKKNKINSPDVLGQLIEAIESLLAIYGISAKRTVGWGTVNPTRWKGFIQNGDKYIKDESQPETNTVHSFQEINKLKIEKKPPGLFADKKTSNEFKERIKKCWLRVGASHE